MRGHNICFYSEIRKIIFELSSVPHLIWTSVKVKTPHKVYANDAGKVICTSHGRSTFALTGKIKVPILY